MPVGALGGLAQSLQTDVARSDNRCLPRKVQAHNRSGRTSAVLVHARWRHVHGSDAHGSIRLDISVLVLAASDPLEALPIELERAEVSVIVRDLDILQRGA